jgi:hypothetical protein
VVQSERRDAPRARRWGVLSLGGVGGGRGRRVATWANAGNKRRGAEGGDTGFLSADLENGTLSSVMGLYKNLILPQTTGNPLDTRMCRIFHPLL